MTEDRRAFRALPEHYEAVRAAIDAMRGLPANGLTTTFDPAELAPTDDQGRCYLSVWAAQVPPAIDALIAPWLADGRIEEVTHGDYAAAHARRVRGGGP